jgi:hypothetical protein
MVRTVTVIAAARARGSGATVGVPEITLVEASRLSPRLSAKLGGAA